MSFIALGQGSPYWKEAVADVASLPSVGGVTGECRLVLDVDEIYEWNGSSWESVSGGGGGSGDVVGPASATDNAVARFDTTTGKLIQNSAATVSDAGVLSTAGALLTGLTASRVVQTDASKNLESSAVTSTQLGYVDFTSSGQTQLDAKQGLDATLTALAAYNTNGILTQTAADTFAGRTITGTANEISVSNGDGVLGNPTLSLPTGIDAAKIADGSVSSTEFQYIGTLSANAQTQLDAKAPLVSPSFTTPSLGVASATSINKVAITAPATGSTLTIAEGKTLTASNTLTFTGTDSSSVAFGAGGTAAYTANKLSAFAATTSAELAGVISDETGSGLLVFGTSPTLTTPNIGVATATTVNKVTLTAPATGSTLTIADGKTLTSSNTLTFTGTDGSSAAFGAGGTVAYTANKLSAFAATSSAELAGVISDETGSGALVFGTSPALTTPTATQLDILAQGDLRLQDSTGGEYVAIQAPATVTTYTLTMPAAVPGASQVLADAGAGDGVMAWVANGGGTPTPTASTTSQWDANVNMSANNFIEGYTTTASSASGTTTLTVTSTRLQYITGNAVGHSVILPVTSTLVLGHTFEIVNLNTSETLDIKSSGSNVITTIAEAGGRVTVTCILTSGTTAASWSAQRYVKTPTSSTNANLARYSGTTGSSLNDSGVGFAITPATSKLAQWNNDVNLRANNHISSYTTTATAAGTTTLTAGSTYYQFFTGSTTQTVTLPVTSTLLTGLTYEIVNNSTGTVTVNSSGGNLVASLLTTTGKRVVCILTSGTDAASWQVLAST